MQRLDWLSNVFQAFTTPSEDWDGLVIVGLAVAREPVKRIKFSVEEKPKAGDGFAFTVGERHGAVRIGVQDDTRWLK